MLQKKCLCAMLGSLAGSIHIIKDIVYDDNKKIIIEIYQVFSLQKPMIVLISQCR